MLPEQDSAGPYVGKIVKDRDYCKGELGSVNEEDPFRCSVNT